MVGWHHRLNGHDFEQTLGDREGKGSLSMGSQRVGHDLVTEQQQTKWEKNLKRTDACICITESVCCASETNSIVN